ncbi:MAG: bile acid:sodium symporter family protein [Flavobacteriaceae bacterium]|nr:bile acid:sodium symporter family protein [Flavobacteriaceae bacterium]
MNSTTGIILAISLIIIMFGLGLSLTIKDFKRILIYPKAILIGLTSQILILPLLGYLIAISFGLSPVIAIGIMLLTACPGGPTSNMVTFLAKGDIALSISLTAFASMLSIITIPLIVQFALVEFSSESQSINLDTLSMIKQMLIIVIIPVSLGMFVKAKASKFATRMDKPVKIASAVIFILVVVGLTYTMRGVFLEYLKEAGLPAIVLNISTMLVGLLLAFVFKLSKPQAISISIESGIQNATLAITIATISLNNPEFTIVPVIYGLLMYVTGTLIVIFSKFFLRELV